MAKITNTGVHIVEGSAAATDTGGEGQIWVKSDTPSSLYHTDDAGTDHRINGIHLMSESTTTGGTTLDFTGIPPGVKQIALMLVQVSTSGSSDFIVQLGDSGGFETSGYKGGVLHAGGNENYSEEGFDVTKLSEASNSITGMFILSLEDSTNNTWTEMHVVNINPGESQTAHGCGSKTLSGELTQIRLTAVNGSDTIDSNAGINISYQ